MHPTGLLLFVKSTAVNETKLSPDEAYAGNPETVHCPLTVFVIRKLTITRFPIFAYPPLFIVHPSDVNPVWVKVTCSSYSTGVLAIFLSSLPLRIE
jgi:hypothetical protein